MKSSTGSEPAQWHEEDDVQRIRWMTAVLRWLWFFGFIAVGTWVKPSVFIMHEGNTGTHSPIHWFAMTSTTRNRSFYTGWAWWVVDQVIRWSDYRAATDMRWAPCTLTQSSCPPGRTVSSRPIRSEQQGGACKVSRERAMGENVSIAPWDSAGQSGRLCLGRLCRLWRANVRPAGGREGAPVCGRLSHDVSGWQTQHSRRQRLRTWPVGYTREKWAPVTYNNCTQNTNKATEKWATQTHAAWTRRSRWVDWCVSEPAQEAICVGQCFGFPNSDAEHPNLFELPMAPHAKPSECVSSQGGLKFTPGGICFKRKQPTSFRIVHNKGLLKCWGGGQWDWKKRRHEGNLTNRRHDWIKMRVGIPNKAARSHSACGQSG